MNLTPHPEDFRGRPRAPDKVLDENMAWTGVGVRIQAPIGAGILTPTPARAIFSSRTLSGARGLPRKSSRWGVGVILAAARNLEKGRDCVCEGAARSSHSVRGSIPVVFAGFPGSNIT